MDNGDVETFKKEPEEALARETGQNSNDARYNSSYTKMDVWLFEYEGEVDLGNATMDEVAQVAWMNREQIKELFDANMFVDTLEYFFTEDDRQ